MIAVEKIEVCGFEPAVRGMRNPMNSWDKSDSDFIDVFEDPDMQTYYMRSANLGHNDLDLMHRLFQAGTEHRKFDRMIVVWLDITAPLYWWKEMDTYRLGVEKNSCSTMHKIHSRDLTIDDFSHEHLNYDSLICLTDIIKILNQSRKMFLETKDKKWWWDLIQLLPTSYNQKRTVMLSYETCIRIIQQRKGHKLTEWNMFVDILQELPYMQEIMNGVPKCNKDWCEL